VTVKLYDFQQELVDKLGKPNIPSRLIGDEMGTGKTYESLAVDKVLRQSSGTTSWAPRTLIVCPLSVFNHWAAHLRAMQPNATVYIIDRKNRPAFIRALQSGGYTHYICHWEALRLKDTKPAIRRVHWFHVIADEVHRAGNRKAQQTNALKALTTRYKTGASGSAATKVEGLWSVLNWLYPREWNSYWRYVNTYLEMETICRECGGKSLIEGGAPVHVKGCTQQGGSFRKITGVHKAAMPSLHRYMEPYYMRRLKEDVLPDLPEKYYTQIDVDLYPRQRKAYDQMRKHMLAWVGEQEDQEVSAPVVIAQLVRLQQFALASPDVTYKKIIRRKERERALLEGRDPIPEEVMKIVLEEPSSKLDALEDFADDLGDEPLVVFTQSRSMVDLVAARLRRKAISVGRYRGEIPDAERDQSLVGFQRGDIQVFVGTIAAGGESIELQRSSTMVFLDRHWSPFRNKQAEDREHRDGQKNAVHIVDIVARNTVDLGRMQQIAVNLRHLKMLLGDKTDPEQYLEVVA
jgi:SNF2 family DNA or RNA helicase